MNPNELVLCVAPEGQHFNPLKSDVMYNQERFSWQPRGTCETDPTYKQVIPYVVYYDLALDSYLVYQRKLGDSRLTGKWSLGIGGHVNEIDESIFSIKQTICANINRELSEELGEDRARPTDQWWNYFRGYIYDPSDEVGSVHLGLVFLRPMALSEKYVFEDTEHSFEVVSYQGVKDLYENMENWSRAVIDALVVRRSSMIFYKAERGEF